MSDLKHDQLIHDITRPATTAILDSLAAILPAHLLVQSHDTIYRGVQGALMYLAKEIDTKQEWWNNVCLN